MDSKHSYYILHTDLRYQTHELIGNVVEGMGEVIIKTSNEHPYLLRDRVVAEWTLIIVMRAFLAHNIVLARKKVDIPLLFRTSSACVVILNVHLLGSLYLG